MRYLYGEADEKFVKLPARRVEKSVLSSFKFRLNSTIQSEADAKEFDRSDVPIVFKCTPDTLLNLCVNVVDAMPLPMVYMWTIEDICKWLRECGYRQYQNTFRENLINGRTLLLVDASALSAMNIKEFDHIKDLSRRIRDLFYFEMTKFGRSLTLYPEFHRELYKLFRVKTGAKYDMPPSSLWRKMQLIHQNEPNYGHWEILERWLANVDKESNSKVWIGAAHRLNLYACPTAPPKIAASAQRSKYCSCLPPCECYSSEKNSRPPWRLKCLSALRPSPGYVQVAVKVDCKCIPPCTCGWSSKMYQTRGVLTCLQQALPHKYGGVSALIRYGHQD